MQWIDVVEEVARGRIVRRTGWRDPQRILYLRPDHPRAGSEGRFWSTTVTDEDAIHDDWVMCGWLQ